MKEQEEQAEALLAKMREVIHVPPSRLARASFLFVSACRAHRRATLTTRRLVLTFSSLTLVVCCSHASQGQARLVEVRASVEATEAEVASLLPAGARAPVLAEDLWCRPLREEAWGAAGVGALERCARDGVNRRFTIQRQRPGAVSAER